MKNQRLPHTCSAQWLSELTPWDDIKKLVGEILQKEKAMGVLARASCMLCAVVSGDGNEKLLRSLADAGFKPISKYASHNHGTKVVIFCRNVSKKEFDTGEPRWPKSIVKKVFKKG